jgi:hypothetical protein
VYRLFKLQALVWAAVAAALAFGLAAFLARMSKPPPGAADAVAALRDAGLQVQPDQPENWEGGEFLAYWVTDGPRDWRELGLLSKARMREPSWSGVVWLRDRPIDSIRGFFALPCCEGCWLDYRTFYVCGDPDLVREVRRVLAARGIEPENGGA